MICQVCGNKTATTHIKSVVNGRLTQYHLCSSCAAEKGYSNLFSDWSFGLGDMLGGFLGENIREKKVERCKTCGASFEDISKSGKVGCADCYTAFRGQLLSVIQRIHGTTQHKGKTPGGSALRITEPKGNLVPVEKSELAKKKEELQNAVNTQNFERAAVLRDEIKEMEQNG